MESTLKTKTTGCTLEISSKPLHVQPHEILVKWNTARYLNDKIWTYRFLRQFFDLNPDIHAIFEHLEEYTDQNKTGRHCNYYSMLNSSYRKFMDNMLEFQLFIATDPSREEVKEKAKLYFDNEHVTTVKAVNMIEIERMNLIESYCEDLHHLLNEVQGMNEHKQTYKTHVKPEVKSQIEEILRNKGLDKFDIPSELLINNQTKHLEYLIARKF
jgi:hypothetical protein